MQITVKVKQAGKKHALIENRRIEIENIGKQPLLSDLIKAIVKHQVEEFNAKPLEKNLLPFLSKDEIAQKAEGGKVGFGSIYNEQKADVEKAQETALLAFEDGIFSVFADDEEIKKLDEKIRIEDATVFTFIRLTFLAGSYW
jgi:hypothetical protein